VGGTFRLESESLQFAGLASLKLAFKASSKECSGKCARMFCSSADACTSSSPVSSRESCTASVNRTRSPKKLFIRGVEGRKGRSLVELFIGIELPVQIRLF